jgi:hypothetical protein
MIPRAHFKRKMWFDVYNFFLGIYINRSSAIVQKTWFTWNLVKILKKIGTARGDAWCMDDWGRSIRYSFVRGHACTHVSSSKHGMYVVTVLNRKYMSSSSATSDGGWNGNKSSYTTLHPVAAIPTVLYVVLRCMHAVAWSRSERVLRTPRPGPAS